MLAEAYPDAHCELNYNNPYELLVATVLSAQTTDVRVNSVTPRLFAQFPTPGQMASASFDEVAQIIRPLGFFRSKATALIGAAQTLVTRHNGQVPADLDALVELPGVGRKTANVVLGNAFGIPGITPDTHVMRVSRRLGWTSATKPDAVERDLAALFPPEQWVMLCHRLIWHGRRCCHARRPTCLSCPVSTRCPSYDPTGGSPSLNKAQESKR